MFKTINNKKLFLGIFFLGILIAIFITLKKEKREFEDLTAVYFKSYLSTCDSSGMSRDNIYTSKKYGFTFIYPEDVIVCEINFGKPDEEYGVLARFHIMKKDLFVSTDATYINARHATDSLKIKIRDKNTPDILKEKIVTDLLVRKIDGINARVGIGELLECKNSLCADIRITRLIANELEYEFIGNQTFDTIIDTFNFLLKTN